MTENHNHNHSNGEYSPPTSRIEAFSDGVFAIVVTLLVLELKTPILKVTGSTHEAWESLVHLLPEFVAFAASFLVIAIFWVNHHQFFHSVLRSDRKLLWYNNLLLFWLSFVPFPTAFLGRYPENPVAAFLYGTVLFMAAASFVLMVWHAFFKSDLADEHISMKRRKQSLRRSFLGLVAYASGAVVAFFSIPVSLVIFLLVPLFYFAPEKIVFFE